ncbi:MAG: hypothetical protein PUF72_06095 [Clostridiales bacterium]|nr:hypothetical protein [Clostridiales bacterium]
MIKKIKTIIAAAAVFAAFAGASAIANAQDYLWLEAEDALTNGYSVEANDAASGGSLMVVNTKTSPDESYQLSFEAQIPSDGKYDIWVLATNTGSSNYSPMNWSINTGEGVGGEVGAKVYDHKIGLFNQTITWSKLSTEELAAGSNVLNIKINEKSTGGMKQYTSAVDCVVIVPYTYMYEPDANMTRPVKIPHSFAYVELENPNNKTYFSSAESAHASGGRMLFAYASTNPNDTSGSEESMEETLNYTFVVDDEKEYDIWYLGCDMTAAHLSGTKWAVDSDAVDHDRSDNGNGVKILNSAGGDGGIPLYWQKLGTEVLSGGIHTLSLKYTYRNLSGSGRSQFVWADCAIIVPKDWNFTPPADESAEDKYPSCEIARFDAKYFAEEYMKGDYSQLKDNIELPPTDVLTPGGSSIRIAGGDCPVGEDGSVERPYFDKGDLTFELPITAVKENHEGVYKIPARILALDKYYTGEIKIDRPSSQVSVDLKLNISEESDITGSVMLVAAVYDENNILLSAKVTEEALDRELKTITAQLPQYENAAYVKVYVLNNRQLADKLCETKTQQW